jgi:AraC-like DNA-binding protein
MKILSKGQYYGHQNMEVGYPGILLSQYQYSHAKTDWHYHENPYFMYVLDGNMKDGNKKKTTLCPKGSLMFNNWQEPHFGSKHSTQAAGFHLEVDKKWFEAHQMDNNLWEGSQLVQNPKIHILFGQLYREFMEMDPYSGLAIEVLLVQISEALNNSHEPEQNLTPNWIHKLKELVYYDTAELNLSYLSKTLGVHPAHISRAVPKYFSMSLGTYIRQSKLQRALPLVLHSPLSLAEIAYICGFSDQSHFNRVFKSYFHQSPGNFRKGLRKA